MLQTLESHGSTTLADRSPARPGSTATKQNAALVKEYFAAISGKEKTATLLDRYVSDEPLKAHIMVFEAAFPRYALTLEDLIAEDDKVVVRSRFQGVHAGDLMGLAPTGKSIDAPFIIVYRLVDGRIAEHWMAIDQMDVLKQLGVAK